MNWRRRRGWVILAVLAASAGAAAVAGNVSAQTGAAPLDPVGCSNGTYIRNPGSNPGLVEDCIALVAVRNHFKSIPANADLEWNTPWEGTRVNQDGIYALDLADNDLSGAIPPEIGNLTSLEELSLHRNNLSGAIPPEIGNLTNLKNLRLDGNNLSGTIPQELGKLTNLKGLNLYRNSLSGAIPPEIGNLTNLQYLHLDRNSLSGAIPAELGKLTNLRHLRLHRNSLSGAIPPELGKLTNLEELNLNFNSLSGAIPAELGKLTNLRRLRLSTNGLYGTIPIELGSLTNLEYLRLSANGLSGAIPAELGELTNLVVLHLGANRLSGAIPAELGELTNLQTLHLGDNSLSGAIPPELGELTNLQYLLIQNNRLSGEIPDTLKASRSFEFCNNQLTGALPSHLHHTGYGGDLNDISSCWNGTFRDDDHNSHRRNIEQIAAWGITRGCDDQSRFCPTRTVNRAQMAAFLHRADARLYGEPGPTPETRLTDVAPDAWYRSYAQWAAANRVIPAPGGAFNPQGPVTRADMAQMLTAVFNHLSPAPQTKGLFTDLTGTPTAAIEAIEGIHNAGITTGCDTNPLRYCPNQPITRAQMATFLVRALNQANNNP